MENRNTVLLSLVLTVIAGLVLAGVIIDGPAAAFGGMVRLQFRPARLITDFMAAAGVGAALVNGAVVGLIGLFLVLVTKISLSGPTFAAIFTMIGFSFFGKTPFNIAPIIFGVYLAGKIAKRTMAQYLIIALFGTALGPLVSTIAFEIGLPLAAALPAAVCGGIVIGIILPSAAVTMLHFHQGYNLYSVGLTCGFLGLFAASFIRAGGHEYQSLLQWHAGDALFPRLLVPVLSLVLIVVGFVSGKKGTLRSFWNIQKIPGQLPSDFMEMETTGGALVNAGVIGLLGSAYVLAVGGDFNGPVLGGLFTIIGFSAFGTHVRNAVPVQAGAVVAALIFGLPLASPGPLLAVIFCTTLGPIAGQFGPIAGFIAGFIHLTLVSFTGPWHGGMNLYNNGFAGGLTAALIISVIQWYNTNKSDFS